MIFLKHILHCVTCLLNSIHIFSSPTRSGFCLTWQPRFLLPQPPPYFVPWTLYHFSFPHCCIFGSLCLECLPLTSLVNSYLFFKSWFCHMSKKPLLISTLALIFSSPAIGPFLTHIHASVTALTTGKYHLFMVQCPPLVCKFLESKDLYVAFYF